MKIKLAACKLEYLTQILALAETNLCKHRRTAIVDCVYLDRHCLHTYDTFFPRRFDAFARLVRIRSELLPLFSELDKVATNGGGVAKMSNCSIRVWLYQPFKRF